jgi:plastocyanin
VPIQVGMKRSAIAAAAALVVAVPVGATAIPAFAATKTVAVKDNFFSPKTLTVKKGTTVKFVWRGRAPHNVKGAGFSSKIQASGTYSKRATRSGTIVCTLHRGMTMRLKVTG